MTLSALPLLPVTVFPNPEQPETRPVSLSREMLIQINATIHQSTKGRTCLHKREFELVREHLSRAISFGEEDPSQVFPKVEAWMDAFLERSDLSKLTKQSITRLLKDLSRSYKSIPLGILKKEEIDYLDLKLEACEMHGLMQDPASHERFKIIFKKSGAKCFKLIGLEGVSREIQEKTQSLFKIILENALSYLVK